MIPSLDYILEALDEKQKADKEAVEKAYPVIVALLDENRVDGLPAADVKLTEIPPAEPKTTAEVWQEMVENAESTSDIRPLREALGMSLSEFAVAWGCSAANISGKENLPPAHLRSRSRKKLRQIVEERIATLS